ncbi:MAG: tetratricopeptide repeat protein [Desulfosarcinaceae bacterium]|nr:tetratricopeptide repeat protein [Desulfosarcinaceae bacterium]
MTAYSPRCPSSSHRQAADRTRASAWWRGALVTAVLLLTTTVSGHTADSGADRERFELQRDLAHALTQIGQTPAAIELYQQLIRNPHARPEERYQLSKQLAFALAATGMYRRAAVELETLLASPHLRAADHRTLSAALAHNLQRSGQTRRATWQWQRVLDQLPDGDPEIPRIQLRLADLFEKLAQDTAAAAIYANLLRTPLDDDQLRHRYAWLHNRHQRYSEAWALIQHWPRPHPNPARLRLQAQTAFWAGVDTAALALYPHLLARWPEAPEHRRQHAELLRRNGRMTAAADSLRWLVVRQPEVSDHRILLVETLLDAGNPAAAAPHVERLLDHQPVPPPAHLLAARVYADLQRPTLAIAQLMALDRRSPLTPDQQLWLADLQRAAGQTDAARRSYAAVARRAPTQMPARGWVALADLEAEVGRQAEALTGYTRALAQLSETPQERAAVHLKIARAATRLGDHERAGEAYRAYLNARPEDGEIQLEAARAFAAQGAHAAAVEHYRRAVVLSGDGGLALELARALTAVQAFDEAEVYARQAVARRDPDPEAAQDPARRLLAEILLYSGQIDTAEAVLVAYRRDYPADPDAILLLAEAALARDHRLAAYTRFSAAADAGAAQTERLSRGLGQSALSRGDRWRAGEALAPLADQPRLSQAAASLLQRYRRATAPRLDLLGGWSSDSNDLILRQVGLQGAAAGILRLPLHLRYTLGEVAQKETDFQRNVFRLGLAPIFPQPHLSAQGYLGIEAVGDAEHHGGATLPVGEILLRRYWADDSSLGLAVTRETVWTPHDSSQLHRYHRVTRLAGVEPAFARSDLRLLMDKRLGDGGRFLQTQLGGDLYSDDNRRLWAYTHLQQPLIETGQRWLAVKPNLFYEGFADNDAAYFSPSNHVSLGLILQHIERLGRVAVDLEVNPQLLITDGETGWGGHWHLKLTAEWGPLFAGGGVFGFYDQNDDYLLWRTAARVGWHF